MTRQPVFIDCDPGLDDFIAIQAAFRVPHWEIAALGSVAGYLPVQKTTQNIAKAIQLAGSQDIPFAAGAERPLAGQPVTVESAHGKSGLGSVSLPASSCSPISKDASQLLIEKAAEYEGALMVVATGPLTNLARAFISCPALPGMLRSVVFTGGGHAHGNITPKAEFNIFADPHAAHIVCTSGVDVTMVGLDAAMAAGWYGGQCTALCSSSDAGRAINTALCDLRRFNAGLGLGDIAYIHGLTAVVCAAWPELFNLVSCHVDIELKGRHTLGQTVCDLSGAGKKPSNANVAMGLDEEPYRAAIHRLLAGI